MPADDNDRQGEPGGLGGWLIALGRRLGGEAPAARQEPETGPAGAAAPVDIVDQAEAFKTLRVSEVMTPRADIVALDVSATFEEVVRAFAEAEHSRLPIYRETLDEPIGVANIRDVFKLLQPPGGEARRPGWKEPVLKKLRRQILYVPGSMRAADLLVKMQAARIHMAMVIDEYGGVDAW